MTLLDIGQTSLAGVLCLTPRRFEDARGYFSETWNSERMAEAGLDLSFVQDNQSYSAQAGTLRGLHFQAPPMAQAKLVRCSRGCLFDVAVDIRAGSPTYGQWTGVELSAENGRQLLIPEGFAHGFVTREDHTEIQYKCTRHYAPDCEGALIWDDPGIGVHWGLNGQLPLLSDKDMQAGSFAGFDSPFAYEG